MADRTVVIQLRAAVGQFNAQMASAAASTRGLQSATTTAATAGQRSMGRMGQAATGLRGALGGISPTLVGAGGLAFGIKKVADAAIGWESAFADVRKTVDGTPGQLEAINSGLRGMSQEIPTSAEDLAGIAASAGQLGIETDNVLEFTRVIADLGETTNLAGEQGATELARFANIVGMSQDDFDRLGSTIVDLGNNFATTEAEISQMAMRIAGAGAQIGLAESDILGIATALSSVGIEAQAGGTAISRVMIDIANEVSTGGDRLERFGDVAGMSAEEFSTAWRDDAAGALVAFITGLGSMEERGGDALQVLDELELSEIRVRDALLRASGAGDLLADAIGRGSDAWEENNALQEEAALRYDTTEAKLQIARNSIKELARDIGDDLLPAIGQAASGLTDLLNFEIPGGEGTSVAGVIARGLRDTLGTQFGLHGLLSGGEEQADTEAAREMTDSERSLRKHLKAMREIPEAAEPAGKAISELVGPYSDLTASTEDALAAQQEHVEWMEGALDPIFQLNQAFQAEADAEREFAEATEAVTEAKQALSAAIEESGAKSDEAAEARRDLEEAERAAEQAAWDHAEAEAALTQAAINGEISFGDFEKQLREWVNQGRISAEEADIIRERVRLLRQENERYDGDYFARFHADTKEAQERVRSLINQVARIPRNVNVSVGVTQDNIIARIPGTGQIPVGPGGRMHSGGVVSGMAGAMDGLAQDERLRILQLGEVVVPRGRVSGSDGGAQPAGGIHIDKLVVRAYSDRFSISQLSQDLQLHQAMQGSA